MSGMLTNVQFFAQRAFSHKHVFINETAMLFNLRRIDKDSDSDSERETERKKER